MRGVFKFWELAQAVQDHCDKNLAWLVGCTTRLGWQLASATTAAMLSRGDFGPDVVGSMVCAMHRLVRGPHGAATPTGEYLGAAAFADAWASDLNRTLCVDSSGGGDGGGGGGGNAEGEGEGEEADDAVAEELCLRVEEPSCKDLLTRHTCCAYVTSIIGWRRCYCPHRLHPWL